MCFNVLYFKESKKKVFVALENVIDKYLNVYDIPFILYMFVITKAARLLALEYFIIQSIWNI